MTGEVIKSFMVGLGFGVDDASLAKFNKALASSTLKVTALATAAVGAAAAIAKSIISISGDFEQLGYEYRLIAPSINKVLLLRQEMLHAYQAAGINIYKTIQASVKLNFSLDRTKIAFKALYTGVAAKFFPLLQKQSDMFRNALYKNMPKIQHGLEAFIKIVFKALEIVTQLGARVWSILTHVYEFFAKLHQATDGWSTVILGVVAAWKLLNLEFLASPLGLILAGFAAILLLFDDFETWKEGGKSLFDWSYAVPVINAISDALGDLWTVLKNAFTTLGFFARLITDFVTGKSWGTLFDDLNKGGEAFNKTLMSIWDLLKGIWSLSGAVGHAGGQAIAALLGNGNAAANIQNNPVGQPLSNPVGPGSQGGQTNQHVQQQTTINVNGAQNAGAVGHAVAGHQGQVNRNMVDGLGKTVQ